MEKGSGYGEGAVPHGVRLESIKRRGWKGDKARYLTESGEKGGGKKGAS